MIKIDLKYSFNQQWYSEENISVIGFAYSVSNQIIKNKELISYFKSIENSNDFEQALCDLNGNFAVVIQNENCTFFAVDKLRTYPLLYSTYRDNIYITDNTSSDWIHSLEPNLMAQNQLIDFWCVLNNETLKNNLYQLQAGEFGLIENNRLTVKTYFKHYNENKFDQSDEVVGELDKLQFVYFDKWYEQIKNKEVWIPLSGGYDSRYILAMLVKYGHPKIHTYTYGRFDGFEAKEAQKVVKKLSIDWHFVEYNEKLFNVFFDENWKTYALKNHYYTSLPHEQDYFALWQLQNKIGEDSFIIPGFCGDFLAGSQFISDNPDLNSVYKKISNSFGISLDMCNQLINIQQDININDTYQQWFLQQKVSKFIINSIRVYQHFGYNILLPLWDNDWMNFWYKVPYSLRENQLLYKTYLMNKIFKPLKIDFTIQENYSLNFLKDKLKSITPKSLLNSYQVSNRKNDINNLNILYELIYEKLGDYKIKKDNHINRIHAQYMLNLLNLANKQNL